ncbi:GAF domain-containing protein [Nostoc sp. UCD121]|uniref:GAF domain-containing protein n=1 Tax=unclassified Nostoc TaxID=2593658 RepID=UPI001629B4FD|nr:MULTISPECIES: GAF domain-containing protein [unclassified Nostoc]MBC1221903.1 GAF domain-containing protein [Nostoc sp. UCD120]MBC1278236.1 GAF domain-containing protein [Nostoc sp. UCD121]MBC1294500.1 GAF domain-containing protein [Nostoc sp. UCD122]
MFNRLTSSELKSAIVCHPLVVKPDTTVMEAIAQMSGVRILCETAKTGDGQLDELYLEARSSCVLVVEKDKLLGIFTERDVVRLSAQQCAFENLAIREVMIHPVVTQHESDFTDLFFAVNLLQQYRIRHLPILDDRQRVVGLVTNESLRQSSRPVDLLRLRLVCEVMTSEVICAALDSSMLAIAQLMAKHRVSSIMIVQPGGSETEPLQIPVGIITERDIVQFQALSLNLKTCLAEAVMSTPIFAVKPEDSLWMVQQIMEQRLIRRLAVTGKQGELLGIVTQTNLLQALNPLELYKLAEVLEKKSVRLEAEKIELLETRTNELEQQIEARMMLLRAKAERERLVLAIALQIRSSLSLQTILDTTVAEVRQLLGCDRVNIWQFEADWQTIAVAESTDSSLSLIGERVSDNCLKQDYTEIYRQGRIRIVSDIYKSKISDCHRDMLIHLQTRAKILVPLFCGDQLWGLLNVTESQHPRDWEPEEVELLQALSVQLAVALQQATTHQKLQEQLHERQRIELILQKLVTGTAAVTGEDFFPALVHHIAEALNVRYAFVSQLVGDKLHTLGFWANGALQPSISYDLAHTPCEYTLVDGEFYCQSQVQELFPDNLSLLAMQADSYLGIALKDNLGNAIGNLCILDMQPFGEAQRTEAIAILQVFAARAAAELQRQAANNALHRLNQDLEKRVEQRTQELQAREAQLRDLFNNATDLIQIIAIDGRIIFVNRAWKETLGYNDTDLEQLSIFQVIHPDEIVHCQIAMQNLFAGSLLGMETRFLTKDGKEIIVEGNINCQLKDGIPIAIRGIFRDITQRKQSENALHESQQFLQTVLDTFPLFVFWKNRESVYLGCNQNFANAGRLASSAEIIGKTDHDLPWKASKADLYEADDRQVMDSGTSKLGIVETQHLGNGEMTWLETNKLPLRNLKGEVIGILGTYQDISDRKRAELALQSSEIRFRQMFDSSVVGMLFADFQGKILDANDRFLQMVGYTRDDLDAERIDWLGMTAPEHIHADIIAMEHLMQHGAINPWEKEYYRKDGSKIPVLIGAAILPGSDNQTICIVVDISEQQAALRERKQAEETIRQQVEREQLLREITQRIRQSLDLQTIFDTACQEIRQVIQADRVGIFKFYPESNFNDGEFVAESVVKGFPSVVAIRLHDHCFGENYSSFYALGRFHVVNDIYNGGMSPCHIEILAQFQVRATLVVPLLCGEKLWGLLCIHQCATTRQWQQFEIDFTQQLSNQLAIAIQQANLYEQIQSELLVRQKTEASIALQLRRQQTLGTIIQKIRESLDINEILVTVTQQVKEILHCDRVIVFRLFADGRSQIVEEAVSSEFPALKDRHWDNEMWSQEILDCYWQGKPRIVPDVMNDIWAKCLVEFSHEGQIQSKIVAPILQDVRGSENHRWVAPCVTNKLWGVLVVHACQEKRVWKDSEAQLLQQIANQLAIAIQQASLFEQLQQELAERQQAEAKLTDSNQQLAISNQELARATRLKDEFLANMSHELRTPLNAILGMTEGLQEEIFGVVNEKQRKALRTIERSGSHLLELITDILDVAKIEAGQMELDYASISVDRLCQSSLVFIKQQALQKRIQLEIKLQTNLSELLVDERRIRQVLINLLNNAVKFTPERGHITLEVTQLFSNISTTNLTEQHFLHFAVTDTGIGISPENIKKLFQPFVQIDSALNRQYAGTGLGLALVKRIVELHGGRVGLTSELGVGSCFTIDLPYTPSFGFSPEIIADDEPGVTSERDSPSTEEAASLTPLILLAEDNEANISTVSSYLQAKGYRIVLAQNGQEAINVAKIHNPDLILMDIQMPGMDGLEAMRQIRLDSNLVDIPIVALTALVMTGDRDRCFKAGANDYLSKPIKLKQLATTIQQLLNTTKDHE